jgi:DNA processing protein
MLKNNIDIISINDKEYPIILKEIYDPPISLYTKGDKSILNTKAIGIVGCRENSEYGKSVAKYFAYNLAKQGINIISGLAKGVDSYAHIGTICAQNEANKPQIYSYPQENKNKKCGKTIAIVGNGLDIIYPKENDFLEKQIIETGGVILSEYPLGTKPDKMNFPARNRIISGMSEGILVVEAKEKSGTLITVDFALEQGRDVFVVPGNINSINSVGTNSLIKQGAKLVTHFSEIC